MVTTDFVTGDVFLFEADSSCISRLICRLTHAPVSHAAMYFKEGLVVEEASPTSGIRTTSIEELQKSARPIHVRRYYRSSESAAALVATAQKHLDDKQPYSLGNLVMLGVLILFNEWRPNARSAVKELLALICILLAKAIDARVNDGKAGATCSQLVYDVYDEAGFQLHIVRKKSEKICAGHDVTSPKNLIMETLADAESGTLTKVDITVPLQTNTGDGDAMEKLCCLILSALENGTDNADLGADPSSSRELHEVAGRFAVLLHRLAHPENGHIEAANESLLIRALRYFIEHYSGFVSPGDLYFSCPDIENEIAVLGKG